MDVHEWLRGLGAVRPMATACEEVLVLGGWNDFYPIMWRRGRRGDADEWYLFGVLTAEPLTEVIVRRILGAIGKQAAREGKE